ncbi:MAG: hypothetical protein PHG02_01825 [Oscillospiraceae bacterium]|nr:hypothetical protein [Oscillospiraceae bacterium]
MIKRKVRAGQNAVHNQKINYKALRSKNQRADGSVWYNEAIDEKGYFLNQHLLKDVQFGAYTSDYNGCGWVAAYNALLMLGQPMACTKVISGLDEHLQWKGKLGLSMAALMGFFLKQGCQINFGIGLKSIEKNAQTAQTNILYYFHPKFKGAHFVAFIKKPFKDKDGNAKYQFYNSLNAPLYANGKTVARIIPAREEIYNAAGDPEPYEVVYDRVYAPGGRSDVRTFSQFMQAEQTAAGDTIPLMLAISIWKKTDAQTR